METLNLKNIFAASVTFSLFILIFATGAFAQNPNPEPAEVEVGVYILNVGKFDLSTGSYTVDFYLSLVCEQECEPGNFEFLNGRATSVDKIIDEPDEKFYRIQASLSQNVDLRNYPFDLHELKIELEDKLLTKEELVYVPNEKYSGIDPSVIIVGWNLREWETEVVDHYYEPYDETFSRYVFSFTIERTALTSVTKSFLPVFFMVFIALLSLLLVGDRLTTRLTLNISTLLAAVFFHLNLTNTIPPVGYLTFADKFMVSTYIILITVLFTGILQMKFGERKDHLKAEKIQYYSLRTLPVFTILIYLATFLLFL